VLQFLVVLVIVAALVWLLLGPLRPGRMERVEADRTAEEADLEAAREAKYREIREAELDHRTGKLSEDDWHALDRDLRAEAVDILRRLDDLRGAAPPRE
jgi:hypothetical protein